MEELQAAVKGTITREYNYLLIFMHIYIDCLFYYCKTVLMQVCYLFLFFTYRGILLTPLMFIMMREIQEKL